MAVPNAILKADNSVGHVLLVSVQAPLPWTKWVYSVTGRNKQMRFCGRPHGYDIGRPRKQGFSPICPKWSSEFMKYPARGFMILLVLCFALPAVATQRNVVNFGAVGNGSHDHTAA